MANGCSSDNLILTCVYNDAVCTVRTDLGCLLTVHSTVVLSRTTVCLVYRVPSRTAGENLDEEFATPCRNLLFS